jgi:hypothetical protein
VALWDESQGKPRLIELPAVCRKLEATDPLEAPRLVPSAIHFLENPGPLDLLGSWPPVTRRFLCRRFLRPMEVVRQLSENALCDPQAGVRLRNLLILVRQLPEDPQTLETLRAARSDASPEIRLRAAMELGTEGREVLMELAESDVNDAWSAQALSIVGPKLSFEQARTILIRALRRRRFKTACACLEALGHAGAAAVDVLAKVLAREKGELPQAAAVALGATGSAAAEPRSDASDSWPASAGANDNCPVSAPASDS